MSDKEKGKYWMEFIDRFEPMYKVAEELGLERRLVDNLVIEAYRMEIMKRYNVSSEIK